MADCLQEVLRCLESWYDNRRMRYADEFFLCMRLFGMSIQNGKEYCWNIREGRIVNMFGV
jgi:hypothetical protein